MPEDPDWIRNRLQAPSQYQCGLAWDGTQLWHSDQDLTTLFAIDPSNGEVTKELTSAWIRADLTFNGTHLVQVGGRPKRLVYLSPDTGHKQRMQDVVPKSGRLTGIEYVPNQGYWMLFRGPTTIQLREPVNLDVIREFPACGQSPSGLTVVGDHLVHADFETAELRTMSTHDGSTGTVVTMPGQPTGMTWDGENIWVCDFTHNRIVAIDPTALGLHP